jgi:hypothetical protein
VRVRCDKLRAPGAPAAQLHVTQLREFHDPHLHNRQSTIHNPQPAIHNPQSTIHNPQSAIHNPHLLQLLPACMGSARAGRAPCCLIEAARQAWTSTICAASDQPRSLKSFVYHPTSRALNFL